jgi:hypothetical protein
MIRPRSKWANGARVAARLQAFGAEIVFHDPFLDPSSDIARQVASEGWSQTELDELLERSRFVSLHARLTDDNRGMVGREEIAPMPAGAVLVNCARGGLLDYDALCDALDDGHLFGAAVDVFPEEPVPRDSRLLRSPHLVITPHRQAPARRPRTTRHPTPGRPGRRRPTDPSGSRSTKRFTRPNDAGLDPKPGTGHQRSKVDPRRLRQSRGPDWRRLPRDRWVLRRLATRQPGRHRHRSGRRKTPPQQPFTETG